MLRREKNNIHCCQCEGMGHISYMAPKAGHLCKLTYKILLAQNLLLATKVRKKSHFYQNLQYKVLLHQ